MISLLDVGNVFFFTSGFLMLYTAYKDRKVLKGYNLLGAIQIVLAVTFFLAFYIQQGFWLSLILTLPNYGYWVFVALSIIVSRVRKSGT